ncbi:MAG: hypothetical protein CMI02_10060 [Oceanospirillaceae bacterium]|uniref:hypothetical protein n=1 Tax=Marinobacter nauticus TaxID=2743 RepID=UPI000C3C8A16|nr:hypothetical protein [Oceanospirillaceae bacterium]MBT12366.1 hypothetical protein [Oceanospirillaceae bacterium]
MRHSALLKQPVCTLWMLMLLVIARPAGAADDKLMTQIYKLPVEINAVSRVCPWRSKAGQGYIRLIRTDALTGHRLYLQWVRRGIAGAPTQATSTVPVQELEEDYEVRIEMPAATLGPHACKLSAIGEDITSERRYRFDFTLKGPGDYKLGVTHLLEGGL